MAWDATRPIPWKRLGMVLGIYLLVMLVFVALSNANEIGSAVPSLVIAILLAGAFMVVMHKFGWTMPMLRSRDEIAELRAQRMAMRNARRSSGRSTSTPTVTESVEGPRPKPEPTRRTTTGPSQHKKKR